jgi:hypothetical protein
MKNTSKPVKKVKTSAKKLEKKTSVEARKPLSWHGA